MNSFVPLRLLLPWPEHLFPTTTNDDESASFLDMVGVSSFSSQRAATARELTIEAVALREVAIGLAPLPGFALILGSEGGATTINATLSVGETAWLRHEDLTFRVRFPSLLFRPARMQDGEYVEDTDENGALRPYEITVENVSVTVDGDGDIKLEGSPAIRLEPVMIGETGIVIEAESVELYLSDDVELPTGVPENFRGVFLSSAHIYLPHGLNAAFVEQITLEDCYIGAGGFTGAVSLPDIEAAGTADLAGLAFTPQSLSLSFVQNAITEGALTGQLTIPFFDEVVSVALSLGVDGSFSLTLTDADENGIYTLAKEGLGALRLTSLGLVLDDEDATLVLSGSLTLEIGGPVLQWPEIGVQNLRISPNGEVKVDGCWIDLPEPKALDLYGFRLEISQIGFGNEEDGRRWIGFSGGVHLVDALPTGASVEGLRVIWDPTGAREPELTLQGVGIELTIPNVLHLSGDVAMIQEDTERFFKGNASLDLLPIGVGLDASIKIGRNQDQDFNYIYTFLNLELPIGIPLWATGAAIYGISGLYGMNVLPATTNNDWYAWYTGPPEKFNVTNADKWSGALDGRAFGAGMVIGTMFDVGRVVSTKALFALILPGPVILFNGKASFLQSLPKLGDASSEGVFDMLAVLDGQAGNLQLNIDAGWSLSKVVDINASAEAYFDFANPRNWHLYLGQDTPEDRRIRAYVISLFHADSFLMIDSDGIATGFGVSWGVDWKFGPVKAILRSWIEAGAAITWQPPQLEGSLSLGGEFEVSVAGFGVGIGAEAILSGKAPTLYWVRGELILSVKLPWPLKDLEEDIALEWKQEATPPSEDPFKSIGLEHLKVSESWMLKDFDEKLHSDHPLDPTDADYNAGPIVPLDARPSIVFDRPMKDVVSDVDLISVNVYPGGTKIGDHTFDYELQEIILEKWPKAGGKQWERLEDLYGTWMAIENGNGEPADSKLQLWAKTPFEFTRRSSRVYRDAFLSNHPTWPCAQVPDRVWHCIDWEGYKTGVSLGPVHERDGASFIFETHASIIALDIPACETQRALDIPDNETVWVIFPEPARNIRLCLAGLFRSVTAYSNGVAIKRIDEPDGAVVISSERIDSIELKGWDNPYLSMVCYETEASAGLRDAAQEYIDRIVASLTHWESEDQILEPEMWYRLTVNLETARAYKGDVFRTPYSHYAYFQTAGPPGLTPPWALSDSEASSDSGALVEKAYPEGGQLTDLSPYIQWTIPANGAAPVYRAYDIGAEFNENYVEQMYGADMLIRLLDINGAPIRDEEGNEVSFVNQWAEVPTVELTETEAPYVARLRDCGETSGYTPSLWPNQALIAGVGDALAPQTMYSAEMLASFVLFQGGLLDGWTDPDFDWDELTKDNSRIAAIGRDDWDNYRLEFNVAAEDDSVGAIARFTKSAGDVFSCYRLIVNPNQGTIRLARLEGTYSGGVYNLNDEGRGLLWSCAGSDCGIDFEAQEHAIALSCNGAEITVEVDGLELIRVPDENPLPSGKAGIYFTGAIPGGFSEFIVRSAPRKPVYRWSFITSKYEGLVELMDTFVGQVFTEEVTGVDLQALSEMADEAFTEMGQATNQLESARQTLEASAPEDVAANRLAAQQAAARRTAEAISHFDSLFESLFGARYRPAPKVLEISEIVEGRRRYALLIESPEPLDWSRLDAKFSMFNETSSLFEEVEGVSIVWNDDGTKALIIGHDSMRNGERRLHFDYHLDLGAEAPLLRRNGSALPEGASLFFTLPASSSRFSERIGD